MSSGMSCSKKDAMSLSCVFGYNPWISTNEENSLDTSTPLLLDLRCSLNPSRNGPAYVLADVGVDTTVKTRPLMQVLHGMFLKRTYSDVRSLWNEAMTTRDTPYSVDPTAVH